MVPVVLVIVLLLAFLVLSGQSLMQNLAAGLLLQARAPIGPVTGSRAWVTWAGWRRPMCAQSSFGRVMARSSTFPTSTF